MILLRKSIDFSFRGWLVGSLFLAAMLVCWAAIFGFQLRNFPSRCRLGFVDLQTRCCAKGQAISRGHCVGVPELCPAPYQKTNDGCIYPSSRIKVTGGSVSLGPTDWDSAEVAERVTFSVRAFLMDQTEVDQLQYSLCVQTGHCKKPINVLEAGSPVSGVTAEEAANFCRYKGGRLPSEAEWTFAAAGSEGRRFPWGAHGLVCRRASFGLQSGPCAQHGSAPEISGMRPEGSSPDGFLDLAGNVAEWVVSDTEEARVRGGSFRSKTAAELKTWSQGVAQPADDVGFRCAYAVNSTNH